MKLSHRLEVIASFVKPGSRLADIGTDHGYIPIYLAQEGVILSGLAMDVREGPLSRARSHIEEAGLSEKIKTRLSDGLSELSSNEADTVVIAGMGGELEIHILEEGRHVWETVSQWVLSPQSDLDRVRQYLLKNGFSIDREEMVKEDGKFYTIMDVSGPKTTEPEKCRREEYEKECYYLYGKKLIEASHPVLAEFLDREKKTVLEILKSLELQMTESARIRSEELLKKLQRIEEAQHEMQIYD